MQLKEQPVESSNLSDAQARLLRMLSAVSLDGEQEAAPATAVQRRSQSETTESSTCTNCDNTESWGMSPWCPKCGFYPKLNRVMEGVAVETTEQDPMEELDLNQIIPPWTYSIVIGAVAIVVESIVARFLVADLATRSSFSQFQIMVGLIAFMIAHGRAYIIAAMASTKFTPGSAVTQPIAIWSEVFKVLPKQKKILTTAVWSITAIMMAVSVIGLDWDGMFKPAQQGDPKINPFKWIMKTVVSVASMRASSQAMANGGAAGGGDASGASFEDSLKGFADVAGGDLLQAAGAGQGGGSGGALGMIAGTAVGINDSGALDTGGGDIHDSIGGAVSGLADVTGASEGIPGGVTGTGSASAVFSKGEGTTSTGPVSTTATPSGTQADSTGNRVVSPASPTGSGSSPLAPTGGAPKPVIPAGSPTSGTSKSSEGANRSTGKAVAVPQGHETIETVIFGYTTNAAGEMRSLLLAQILGGKRARFIGRMSLDDVSHGTVSALEKELESMRTRKPAVSCPYGGRWVQPVITCTVSHDGWTIDGRLNDARFLGYRSP